MTLPETLELAVRRHTAGDLGKAESLYRQVLDADPGQPAALHLLGVVAYQNGDAQAAADLITRSLDRQPGNPDALNNLGNALHALGRREEAAESYAKAVALRPDFADALGNLGKEFRDLGRAGDAAGCLEKALALKPGNAGMLNDLGAALLDQGAAVEARARFEQAITARPDYPEALNNLGNALHDLGRFGDAAGCYRKALDLRPGYASAHSNLVFSMNYAAEAAPAEVLAEARRFGAAITKAAEPVQSHANDPDPERPLRVGLVSGDFCNHSVGYFLDAVLPQLDAAKLKLFAYAASARADDMTGRLKKAVSRWRDAAWMDDAALAQKITADGIDVLVDLSGHTAHNRLGAFALKPAPVQVTWLGYSGTTGLDAVDYVLCDRWVLPPGEEAHFSETPWRLPDSYLCFGPPDLDVAVGPLPAESAGFVTFGCFNTLSKITDGAVSRWAEILDAVPESRLFLKARQLGEESVKQETLDRFARHGVRAGALVLKGLSPDRASHLEAYNAVDVALDPFPYAGTTTSVEALWMGVPVLTLEGARFMAHAGESILRTARLGEWIAGSERDYAEKAAAFASDLPGLAGLRRGLRQRLLGSPLCNAPRFARNLEDAFRGMWRAWCEQES